jgi:hypothetical protein
MVEAAYPLRVLPNATFFSFKSEGRSGVVVKIIVFQRLSSTRWNLAFGDLSPDHELDDSIVTNNADVARVLGSVAQAIYFFSEKYPERSIFIQPVDEKRQRLYNIVFKRRWAEIAVTFHVLGKNKDRWEDYSPEQDYEAFELLRKPSYF